MYREGDLVSAGELFPLAETRAEGMLPLDGGHVMAWSEAGNPAGPPAVFLHGGPGAGALPMYRRFFRPEAWRIVLFDQRGAGRSTPHAGVAANTTRHLVADMERLRDRLGIERWLVFGGSWGSTLALAYGAAHPERCLGFVLRGVFLGSADEVDWFLYGMGRFFPEAYRAFLEPIPADERRDLLGAYYRRLTDPDPAVHMPAARVWSQYESACSTLRPTTRVPAASSDRGALSIARIEAHYFKHRMFLEPDELIRGVEALRALPAVIVQGRYDMVCPPETADRLARAWPEAEHVVVPDAGHSAMEPGIREQLVRATEKMRRQLRG